MELEKLAVQTKGHAVLSLYLLEEASRQLRSRLEQADLEGNVDLEHERARLCAQWLSTNDVLVKLEERQP